MISEDFDKVASWLKNGQLFSMIEGFLLEIQDQVINTRNYKKSDKNRRR